MPDVERWAELRREHFVRAVGVRELARRYSLSRNTVRTALRSQRPPTFNCPPRPSQLDPFREEIARLLGEDPRLPAVRVRELIEPLGFRGGQTIVNDCVRELRPLFAPKRTFQRTLYRPGEICQFDLWEPSQPIPVGAGQRRRGYVVIACLGYSRAGAGALVFSKQALDLLAGIVRCRGHSARCPSCSSGTAKPGLHAGGGRDRALRGRSQMATRTPAVRTRDQHAWRLRRRRCAPRICQAGRLCGRRGLDRHPTRPQAPRIWQAGRPAPG